MGHSPPDEAHASGADLTWEPKTSKKHPEHRIYPYLLKGLAITRPNQVWAMDITYIPMARGFIVRATPTPSCHC